MKGSEGKGKKGKRIVFPYALVLLPCLVVIVIAAAAAAWYLHQFSTRMLEQEARRLATALDYALMRELGRLEAVGAQEDTIRLLQWARNNRASLLAEAERIAVQWGELGASDRHVQLILGNSCAETLRRICQSDPALEQVMVIDDAGLIVAAAYRPDRPRVANEAWFESTRARPRVRLTVADLRNKQRRSLLVPILTDQGGFIGVVRGDVTIKDLWKPDALSGISPIASGVALGLVGPAPVLLAGQEADFNLFVGRYMDTYGLEVRGGILGSYGRRGVVVPLVLAMEDSAEVGLALVGRHALAGVAVLVPVGILLSGVILLWALKKMTDSWLTSTFLTPYAEVLEAGRWIIDRALHKPVDLRGILETRQEQRQVRSAIRRALEDWLGSLRRAAEDEIALHTAEMQRDLELAREFQLAYLERPSPDVPAVHVEGRLRLEFRHLYHPALALGGDFFDILPLGPDAAGIFIADVMGHGTRSALITAMLRTLIGDLASQGRNARHFLTELNRQFCNILQAIPSPLFASAFYFVADTTARVGTYSSAGHPVPFHVRRSVGRISRLEVPEPHGAALGLIPDEKYTGGHVRLIDGDLFLFYTDGVYEARNASGEEYGIDRLEATLRSVLYRSGEQILREIYQSVLRFVGDEPIADDICMVTVEVTTAARKKPED